MKLTENEEKSLSIWHSIMMFFFGVVFGIMLGYGWKTYHLSIEPVNIKANQSYQYLPKGDLK